MNKESVSIFRTTRRDSKRFRREFLLKKIVGMMLETLF